jgi:hypothetical protein
MKQMSHLTKLEFGLVFLLGLMCILQVPAYAEEGQRHFASKSLIEYARKSKPVKNKEVLQSRLRIPARRAQTIFVGSRGKERVNRFLANDSGETGYKCTSHGCSCHGDGDCNLMFTQVCADPATNGACTGNVCTCTP